MRTVYFDTESGAIADLVQVRPGCYLITRINVPRASRGKGAASRLLDEVLADADSEGAALEIHPMPSGGLSRKELVSWYSRHGFQWGSSIVCPEDPVQVLVRGRGQR